MVAREAREILKDLILLLWEEYKAQHPQGYQYSQFAVLYRRFEKRLSVVLRQVHRGGEQCFVDFCDGLALIDEYTTFARAEATQAVKVSISGAGILSGLT